MTESADFPHDAVEHLQRMEAVLLASGLSTRLHLSATGADLTATLHRPERREVEVLIDDDGYTEVRYWANTEATPHQAVAIISRVISVIATAGQSPDPIDTTGQAPAPAARYDGPITQRAGEHGMSGPGDNPAAHDRGDETMRPREHDQPREARPQPTELQERLEQLPAGHPSSPFRDNGTRKPPPVDLSKYELPDDPPPEPDQNLPTDDKPRADTDGFWHWKGLKLDSERSHAADQVLTKCREVEPHLTSAMRQIEGQLEHGSLVPETEKYALKSPDRFKEKFAKLIERFPGTEPDELLGKVADGVRYTLLFDFDHYTKSVESAHGFLKEAGFEHLETRPGWHGDEYKGVNTRWRESSNGVLFEVQLHTQDSWDAKQKTHDAYEKIETRGTPVSEVERLRTYQREITTQVQIPPGALDIKPFKKGRQEES